MRASSPAAVPPYISRAVRGCFGIVYRDKGWSVGLEGDCICSENFGVGCSRNGLVYVLSGSEGCSICSKLLLMGERNLGRGRWGIGGNVKGCVCGCGLVDGKRVIV